MLQVGGEHPASKPGSWAHFQPLGGTELLSAMSVVRKKREQTLLARARSMVRNRNAELSSFLPFSFFFFPLKLNLFLTVATQLALLHHLSCLQGFHIEKFI